MHRRPCPTRSKHVCLRCSECARRRVCTSACLRNDAPRRHIPVRQSRMTRIMSCVARHVSCRVSHDTWHVVRPPGRPNPVWSAPEPPWRTTLACARADLPSLCGVDPSGARGTNEWSSVWCARIPHACRGVMVRFVRRRLPPQRVVVWQDTAPSQQHDQDAQDVVPNALARLPLISWRRRAAGVAAFSHGRSMPDGIPLQMGRTTMLDGIPCDAVRGWGVGDADRVCHRELYGWVAMVYGKSSCRFTSAEPTPPPPHTPPHTPTHAHVYPESASQNEGGKRTSSMLAAHQRALQTRTRSTGTRRGAARAHVRTKPAVAVEYRIPSVHPSGRGVRVQAVAQRDRGGDGRPGLVGRQGASRGHHAAHAGAHRSQQANKTATPAGTTCRMRSSTARAARQSGAV